MDPITEGEVRPLAQRYASVLRDLDLAPGEPLLVLPNGDFFPDTFRGDQRSIEALVARLSGYAGLESEVGAQLVGAGQEACDSSGCGTGGCGTAGTSDGSERTTLVRDEHGFTLAVPHAELSDTIVLTSRLASALSAIACFERGQEGGVGADVAETAAVALGFGVLTLEASYLYRKSCGGPQVGRATALDCRSLAILFALFLAREGLTPKATRGELSVTQRALVNDAWGVVNESPGLVSALKSDVGKVADGRFKLGDGGSFFGRLARKLGRTRSREEAALAALERGASVDELLALVEDPNGGSRVRSRS